MIRLHVAGNAPNRTPSVLGRTVYLRGGSVELLEDDLAAALEAWSLDRGHGADYRFERVTRPQERALAREEDQVEEAPPASSPRLSEVEARRVIGETRRSRMAEIVARVEGAGFDVPEELASVRTKAELVEGLLGIMTDGEG